jgi:quercetin dioxygenase-like cupin family protein
MIPVTDQAAARENQHVGVEAMTERRSFLPETETKVPIIQPPGGGKVVGVLRDQSTFKVLSEQTNGAYAILEQKIPAGDGPPLHVHRHETEIFYILDGQFEVIIGDQTVPAPAGAIVVGRVISPTPFAMSARPTGVYCSP